MDLNITETKSTTRYNDISSVYADLVEPIVENERYTRRCDYYSCFSNHYPVGKEREFIEALDKDNPGKYVGYRITWTDAN
jgi:hypothetical protein